MGYFDAALEKDAKNTSAWLWRGMDLHNSGFLDEAMASLQQCIDIDPGYQNCRGHLARVYMNKGDLVTAHRLHDESLEHGFYGNSEAFVSTYVRSGHRNLALLIADYRLGFAGAPIIEWIRAIENPDGDNSAGFERLKYWESQTDTGRKLVRIPELLLSFRAYDELTTNPIDASGALWHPDGDEFRTTPQFKTIIRQLGVFDYWQARGFPPQCKPIGEDDFECDRP
jgi:tetratricopeptide (TPR) repeat protein